jgi:hypothetical protein
MSPDEPKQHYAARRLPPFIEGTTELIAVPHAHHTIAAVPVTSEVNLMMGTGDYAYTVPVHPGDWHVAYTGDGRSHHRGVGFSVAPALPARTHEQLGEADPNHDPRAAFLRGYWTSLGLHSTIVELRRVTNVHVVGQIAKAAHNSRMHITGGWFTLWTNMFLLANPHDPTVMWLSTEDNMRYEFAALHQPGPGGAPGELVRTF